MRFKKVVDPQDAVAVIRDGDTIASTGYGGNGTPDHHIENRLPYDADSNTVFMNYALLRLKLGRELSDHKLDSTGFEDARAAHAWLLRAKPSA